MCLSVAPPSLVSYLPQHRDQNICLSVAPPLTSILSATAQRPEDDAGGGHDVAVPGTLQDRHRRHVSLRHPPQQRSRSRHRPPPGGATEAARRHPRPRSVGPQEEVGHLQSGGDESTRQETQGEERTVKASPRASFSEFYVYRHFFIRRIEHYVANRNDT